MSQITMPRLSDSVEEGTILSWLKIDGEYVERGEELVEIETDKATVTHQADNSGTLTIIAQEGTTLPVGAPIASLRAEAAESPAADGAAPSVHGEPSSRVVVNTAPNISHPAAVPSVEPQAIHRFGSP